MAFPDRHDQRGGEHLSCRRAYLRRREPNGLGLVRLRHRMYRAHDKNHTGQQSVFDPSAPVPACRTAALQSEAAAAPPDCPLFPGDLSLAHVRLLPSANTRLTAAIVDSEGFLARSVR